MRPEVGGGNPFGGSGGDQIGKQLFVPEVIVAGEHGGFADFRVGSQGGFNFAQLDAEAADLDLMVDAAEVFDVQVRSTGVPPVRVVGWGGFRGFG